MSIKSIKFIFHVFRTNIFNGKISLKKLKAIVYNLLLAFLRISRVQYGPSAIWVEAANYCNLSCEGCWVPALSRKLAPKAMGLDEYKKLIDEIRDTLILLVLQMSGESFLNKHILDMIAYANHNKIIVWISTNGSFQTPDDWGEKVVKSGLDIMYFSISGTTQEEYKRYHRDGNISYVIDNIKKIQAAKKRQRSRKPYLSFRMLITRDSPVSKIDAKRLAKNLDMGLDIRYLTVDYIFDGLEDPAKKKISIFSSRQLAGIKNSCPALWIAPAVQSNGEIIPCCLNFFGLPTFGNINERSLVQIWKGEQFNRFRRAILTDRKKISGCAQCERNLLGFKEPLSREKNALYITFRR